MQFWEKEKFITGRELTARETGCPSRKAEVFGRNPGLLTGHLRIAGFGLADAVTQIRLSKIFVDFLTHPSFLIRHPRR